MSAKPVEYFAVELRSAACPLCEPERFDGQFETTPRPQPCDQHLEHAVSQLFAITAQAEVLPHGSMVNRETYE